MSDSRIAAKNRASSFLEERIRQCRANGLVTLPSLKQLSSEAGVGQSTMHKAVARQKAAGVLTTSEGRGIRLLNLSGAQRKAVDFLFALIDSYRREGTSRLPTVAQLAALAGVSLATMAKAVSRARDAGIVRTTSGSGVYLPGTVTGTSAPAGSEHDTTVPRARLRTWERVARKLGQDIFTGVFPTGLELPSPKELGHRYGVCGKTLSKALADLEQRNRIVRQRSRYVVAEPEGGRHRNTIVLIARGTPEGELFKLTSRTITNLRLLENECSRNGLRLMVVAHNDMRTVAVGPQGHALSFSEALRRQTVLGFIVWTMGIDGPAFKLDALMLELCSRRLPVAIFDEGLWWKATGAYHAPLKVFTAGNGRDPGRSIGRYLLGLGHREIGWVTPYGAGEWAWARERLEGIREEFTMAGLEKGVHVFQGTATAPRPSRRPAQQATRWDTQAYLAALRTRQRAVPGAETPTEQMLNRFRWHLFDLHREQDLRSHLLPLLHDMNQNSRLSAWVGANDEVALQCLDYLQLAGRHVPGEISVVGFDNSPDSTVRGLTTYNFNASAFVHAMVSHVLEPRHESWDPRRDPPISFDGFVTERVTSAPYKTVRDS